MTFFRNSWAFAVSLAILGAAHGTAHAARLVVRGAPSEPYPSGTRLSFTVSLEQEAQLNGYEIFFSWDRTELTLLSASQLLADGPGAAPFTVYDTSLGTSAAGIGRASVVRTAPGLGKDLFLVNVETRGRLDSRDSPLPDASLIFSLSAAGSRGGVSPSSIALSNPERIHTFSVPEAASSAGAMSASAALTALVRFRRRWPERG